MKELDFYPEVIEVVMINRYGEYIYWKHCVTFEEYEKYDQRTLALKAADDALYSQTHEEEKPPRIDHIRFHRRHEY